MKNKNCFVSSKDLFGDVLKAQEFKFSVESKGVGNCHPFLVIEEPPTGYTNHIPIEQINYIHSRNGRKLRGCVVAIKGGFKNPEAQEYVFGASWCDKEDNAVRKVGLIIAAAKAWYNKGNDEKHMYSNLSIQSTIKDMKIDLIDKHMRTHNLNNIESNGSMVDCSSSLVLPTKGFGIPESKSIVGQVFGCSV
jgi:hypothetical protein